MRAHLLVIFSFQETRSWNVLELQLLGYVYCGSKLGLATMVVSDEFSKLRDLGGSKRCTAVLFGAVCVMAVYARDCTEDVDVFERFIKNISKILRQRRRAGAKDFNITGDFNVELELQCADEDDNDELNDMCVPLCWQGCEKRPGRIQEADVVWNYEGVLLQGHFYVVLLRP